MAAVFDRAHVAHAARHLLDCNGLAGDRFVYGAGNFRARTKMAASRVNFLFVALLIIVFGSMIGQSFGVHQKLGHVANFWFGHQGLEYVDLGRFWQVFLFVGLFLWLFLMGRALSPMLKRASENKHLL